MQFKRISLGLVLSFFCLSSFAADQLIKEETTPSAPEGAISADQIPPLLTKSVAAEPPQQTTTTTTVKTMTNTNQAAPAAPGMATPPPAPLQ